MRVRGRGVALAEQLHGLSADQHPVSLGRPELRAVGVAQQHALGAVIHEAQCRKLVLPQPSSQLRSALLLEPLVGNPICEVAHAVADGLVRPVDQRVDGVLGLDHQAGLHLERVGEAMPRTVPEVAAQLCVRSGCLGPGQETTQTDTGRADHLLVAAGCTGSRQMGAELRCLVYRPGTQLGGAAELIGPGAKVLHPGCNGGRAGVAHLRTLDEGQLRLG